MPKRRNFVSVDDKCRLCLCDDGCMSDIFSDDLKLKINDLFKSASISINNDETLPRNICHVCLYKLDMWIDFKEQLIRSDDLLREHLEPTLLDNQASSAKRKHSELQICPESDSVIEADAKKQKSDSLTTVSADCVNSDLKTDEKAHLNDEPVIQDSQKDTSEKIKSPDNKEDSDISSDVIALPCEISTKVKQIAGRRAKTTERRKESTRRWVARKKALLAATGENDTDTDSLGSNEDQLSPVQKARAKCNAEKVTETSRRMPKGLQNLDGQMCGPYAPNGSSDTHVNRVSDSEKDKINNTIKTPIAESDNAQVSSPANKTTDESINPKISVNITNNFTPQSVRSELIVNGETFVITSTLLLAEPHYLSTTETTAESSMPIDEANQQRNTDIIDAVQLRRVNPKNSTHKNDNKLIDTCLNIEVEGTELETLRRVQTVLASFVENEMRSKLLDSETIDIRAKETFQTLDQQLKTIVEKTVKKNLEITKLIDSRGNNTFVGELLQAAMRSKIFQPRVLLTRYDDNRDNLYSRKLRKRKTETEKNSAKVNKKFEEPPIILGKRRSIQPARYADYNTSSLPTESERMELNEVFKKPVVGAKCNKFKTYGPAPVKSPQTPVTIQQKIQKSLLIPAKAVIIQKKSNTSKTASPVIANNFTGEKHICGICGEYFETRKEVENHVVIHRKPPKQKLMRCKRCHEIVEARLVKLHVCSASKNPHKCRVCNATFRTEQLLARHEESHEVKKEIKLEENKTTTEKMENSVIQETQEIVKDKNILMDPISQDRESYTCFVCDKTFTDEELLKDHLQKHCDDISENEQNNDKEYQCAICGKSLNSEDALGAHVEKHLFDDEDDNPNLISITRVEMDKKSVKNEIIHSCGQCSENFDSEMLLMLHMQAHEEEVAIAEWERRGVDNTQIEQHICVICDDVFPTEDELSEHLDIHNGNAHICILCDKPFLTLEELQSHVNTH